LRITAAGSSCQLVGYIQKFSTASQHVGLSPVAVRAAVSQSQLLQQAAAAAAAVDGLHSP
jgi:hypothetical protein